MNHLKLLLRRSYHFLLAPLYRRISGETNALVSQEMLAMNRRLNDLEQRAQEILNDCQRRFAEFDATQDVKNSDRLSEVSQDYQRRLDDFIVLQDKTFVKILDEMMRLSVEVSEKLEVGAKHENERDLKAWEAALPDHLIADLVSASNDNMGMVEASQRFHIPLTTVVKLKSLYDGMDQYAIRRMRLRGQFDTPAPASPKQHFDLGGK